MIWQQSSEARQVSLGKRPTPPRTDGRAALLCQQALLRWAGGALQGSRKESEIVKQQKCKEMNVCVCIVNKQN